MALSNNFSRLIESMKSDSYNMNLEERRDSKQRKEDRAERREERRQDKFQDDEKDFKLNPFIDSLEALKNSIVADYNDAQQRQNPASNLAGAQTGKKYTTIFTRLIDRVAKLKAEAVYQREKDGKFLEVTKDLALINNFRNNYSDLYTDFTEASQSYRDEWAKESEKVIADIEYPTITKPLQDAETLFSDAKNEMVKVLDTMRLAAQQLASGSTGASGATGSTGSTIQGGLTSTIKERSGEAYSGKDGEVVKEVKKLIYEKFKKYDAVSGTSDWSKVYASYPKVSSTLRANTANVIKDVKNGLRKSYKELENDKTGNITPEFYTILLNYKETNESLGTNLKLVSFDSFIKKKLNEGFDVEAVKSGRNVPRGGTSGVGAKKDPVGEANPATPFKTKEEGNFFRVYVNEKDPEYAKKIQLDKSGEFNNKFIRKAFAQYGQQYLKEIKDGTYKISGETEVQVLSNDQIKKVYDYLKTEVQNNPMKWFSGFAGGSGEVKVEILPTGNTFYVQIDLEDANEALLLYSNYTASYFSNFNKGVSGYTRFDADLNIPQGKETDPSSWQIAFRDGQGTFSLKEVGKGTVAGKITGKEKQKQAATEEKMKRTYTDAQYQEMVSELLMNMKGINTAYEGGQVQKLFREKIKTQGDLNALNDAWGLKDGDTLKQWLYDDTLWPQVKKILKEKGLDVSMMAAGE